MILFVMFLFCALIGLVGYSMVTGLVTPLTIVIGVIMLVCAVIGVGFLGVITIDLLKKQRDDIKAREQERALAAKMKAQEWVMAVHRKDFPDGNPFFRE